jgi:hypothetical protein
MKYLFLPPKGHGEQVSAEQLPTAEGLSKAQKLWEERYQGWEVYQKIPVFPSSKKGAIQEDIGGPGAPVADDGLAQHRHL